VSSRALDRLGGTHRLASNWLSDDPKRPRRRRHQGQRRDRVLAAIAESKMEPLEHSRQNQLLHENKKGSSGNSGRAFE
jgi:hypothetical protein